MLYFQLKVKSLPGTAFSIWNSNAILPASLWIWFHWVIWLNGRKWLLHYPTIFTTLPDATLSTVSQKQLRVKDLNRYERRHDSVLKPLMSNFVTTASEGSRLCTDIDGYGWPSRLFRGNRLQDLNANKYRPRPDITIQGRKKTTIIELTCPFEANLEKSRDYKKTRYKNLPSALLSPRAHFHFNLILLEISSLEFTG